MCKFYCNRSKAMTNKKRVCHFTCVPHVVIDVMLLPCKRFLANVTFKWSVTGVPTNEFEYNLIGKMRKKRILTS